MIAVALTLALQSITPTPPISSGAKVSVKTTTARDPIVGRFQGVDSTHFAIGVGDQSAVFIPLRSVSDGRMSLGKDRRKGARRGGLVGLALGTYFFFDTYPEIAEGDDWGFGRLALLLTGGIIAPAAGAVIGALIPPEGWQTIEMPGPVPARAELLSNVVLSLHPEERVRVRTRDAKYTGYVGGNTETLLTITAPETTQIVWREVTDLQVRGGRHRVRGALLGAAALVGVGIYGESTEGATTSTSERIGAFTGAALVGAYLGSRFLGGRGWVSLPLPAR